MKLGCSIVWFRQDLRVQDNTALILACQQFAEVIPVFVFDQQILSQWPDFDARVGFLVDAVRELDRELRSFGSQLYVMYGDSVEIISDLVSRFDVDWVFANRSYGWGAVMRDQEISEKLKAKGWKLELCDDYLLVEPGAVEQRKVFTPFYRLWQRVEKRKSKHFDWQIVTPQLSLTHLDDILDQIKVWVNQYRSVDGWKKTMQEFDFDQYDETRNGLGVDYGTSRLSPYVRFGLISIRQMYEWICGDVEDVLLLSPGRQVYISELAWREFWQHINHYFPEMVDLEFQDKRRGIQRSHDGELFAAWCEGRTGYPIVDAAMRQLKTENWMHWRARMIVASFLTKDLMIDWRWGEQHFARYLIDYDRNVNVGNRQRSASVGADPKPLRIFSPILQAQKFDPSGKYITTYLPELAGESVWKLHDPLTYRLNYIAPIVDHSIAQRKAREMYKGD